MSSGAEERLLAVGEWSDWIPVSFPLAPTQSLSGEVRFFLKGLDPFFELYASPVNIDPFEPAMPVSTPGSYAAELAEATGRFYTQGMPEDTKGLKTGVLTDAEFLAQARIAGEENLRQYRYVLDHFTDGLLFYYFGNVDQVSHMMWRARDPQHPAYDAARDGPTQAVVEELYRGLDAIVISDTLARLGPDDLLVVMSDHGFTSWRRALHLNSWLRDQGYLTLLDPNRADDPGLFGNVDWSRTRAYGLGLNGLYLNVKGREKDGIVDPAEREALANEIAAKLLAAVDPGTGLPAITKMYHREQVYHVAGNEDVAPDLVVGYAKGTRGSDESALGGLPREVFVRQHQRVERRPLHGSRNGAGHPALQPAAEAAGAVASRTWRPRSSRSSASKASPIAAAARSADMFGPRIKLDKALDGQGEALCGPGRLFVGGRVRDPRHREGAGEDRRVRLGRGHQEEAEGAWLHFLSARWRR